MVFSGGLGGKIGNWDGGREGVELSEEKKGEDSAGKGKDLRRKRALKLIRRGYMIDEQLFPEK